jgi:hypothetical protein
MKTSDIPFLTADARPINEDDWGSERQVNAANKLYYAMEDFLSPDAFAEWIAYGEKATEEESCDFALVLFNRHSA